MRITRVGLRVEDPAGAVRSLAALLDVPADGGAVRIGWTRVVPVDRGSTAGVDHLAILVPGGSFAAARRWLADRAPLLARDGVTDFGGPPAWDSTSVYFDGPGRSILELIAHSGVLPREGDGFGPADLLGVCEAGIAVPDVGSAVAALGAAGLQPFAGTASDDFAAIGSVEGKLILAAEGRPWLPTRDRFAGTAPLEVVAEGGSGNVALGAAHLLLT